MHARAIEPRLVADGVVQLGTDLVNWFLVDTADGVVAVDTGLPGYGDALDDGLHLLGRDRVAAVLLSHSHSDHTGEAAAMHRSFGAPVLVHEAELDAVRTAADVGKTGGDLDPYLQNPQAERLLAHFAERGRPEPVADAAGFGDDASLVGGFVAVRTEGHTPGHCVFHLPGRGVLFAGDHLTTKNPLTGAAGPEILPRPLNISSEAMLTSLAALEPLAAQTVVFGHGDPWTLGTEDAIRRAREIGIT